MVCFFSYFNITFFFFIFVSSCSRHIRTHKFKFFPSWNCFCSAFLSFFFHYLENLAFCSRCGLAKWILCTFICSFPWIFFCFWLLICKTLSTKFRLLNIIFLKNMEKITFIIENAIRRNLKKNVLLTFVSLCYITSNNPPNEQLHK